MSIIQWKKILIAVIPLNILPWIIFSTPFPAEILASKGITGIGAMTWVFPFAGVMILASSFLSILRVSENRLKHFFIALLCAVMVNAISFKLLLLF